MGIPVKTNQKAYIFPDGNYYISTTSKFIISNTYAALWFLASLYICLPWVNFLSGKVGGFVGWEAVLFIALIPGYLNIFLLISLLLDKLPNLDFNKEYPPVTLLIAVYNGESRIGETLESMAQ